MASLISASYDVVHDGTIINDVRKHNLEDDLWKRFNASVLFRENFISVTFIIYQQNLLKVTWFLVFISLIISDISDENFTFYQKYNESNML